MPVTTLGKRWTWKRHKCECGDCRTCRSREANKRHYHAVRTGAYVRGPYKPRPKVASMKRYEWDRT